MYKGKTTDQSIDPALTTDQPNKTPQLKVIPTIDKNKHLKKLIAPELAKQVMCAVQ